MLPLRDTNLRQGAPIVTITLIVINVVVFVYESLLQSQSMVEPFLNRWSVIPAELTTNFVAEMPTLVTYMFLHGGWVHLFGNMLSLWIFGDNIEGRLGHVRFIIFYLVIGFLAAAAQVAANPHSSFRILGASGAIAGILGSYLLNFHGVQVTRLAKIVLGFWFIGIIIEIYRSVTSVGILMEPAIRNVALFAHLGGFIAGLALIKLFLVGLPRPAALQMIGATDVTN